MLVEGAASQRSAHVLGGPAPRSQACLQTSWVTTEEGVHPISSAPRLGAGPSDSPLLLGGQGALASHRSRKAWGRKGEFGGGSTSGSRPLLYS